jgi:hypothetical protein
MEPPLDPLHVGGEVRALRQVQGGVGKALGVCQLEAQEVRQ